MKKFNLFKEIIVADKAQLLSAFNSGKLFGIATDGSIVYAPFNKPLIYKGLVKPEPVSALQPRKPKTIAEVLGNNYKIVEDDDRILIKAAAAWQEIIGFNNKQADYDDTSGDGISEFADKALEDIGWHATEFSIGYRDIVEVIESKCDGLLLCIEQEEPYRFSGLGYISDLECARATAFEYCREHVARLIAEDADYAPDRMTDDEADAARFFGIAF